MILLEPLERALREAVRARFPHIEVALRRSGADGFEARMHFDLTAAVPISAKDLMATRESRDALLHKLTAELHSCAVLMVDKAKGAKP